MMYDTKEKVSGKSLLFLLRNIAFIGNSKLGV